MTGEEHSNSFSHTILITIRHTNRKSDGRIIDHAHFINPQEFMPEGFFLQIMLPDYQPTNSITQTLAFPFATLTYLLYFCSPILKLFLTNKQGNEQLRIDGDFYPCAV
jgi:hypothetical protein